MCGRYASFLPAEAMVRIFGTVNPAAEPGTVLERRAHQRLRRCPLPFRDRRPQNAGLATKIPFAAGFWPSMPGHGDQGSSQGSLPPPLKSHVGVGARAQMRITTDDPAETCLRGPGQLPMASVLPLSTLPAQSSRIRGGRCPGSHSKAATLTRPVMIPVRRSIETVLLGGT